MDLPHEFKWWLQGYLQVNQPRIAVSNLVGSQVPTGVVSSFAGSTAPDGWLICDGSAISRDSYAALFETIGTTYGSGDGSTTFNLPNLKGKVPVGFNASETEFDALGETGGAKTHTLTEAEMPAHDHGGSTGGPEVSGSAVNVPDNSSGTLTHPGGGSFRALGSHVHDIPSDGGGGAHNNLQPYIALNYIIKA